MTDVNTNEWHSTACILCSINCGIEVKLGGRRFERVRGDKAHPASKGYTCEKALRLDHYQNNRARLTSPLRRTADGSFEEIDWNTAISEVATRLGALRDSYGGESIFYYGGGGQGNHLCGGYAAATRAALGSVFTSNALAQEKTGEFWVDGQLFGASRCHTSPDFESADVAVFIGKNPWHSHGYPRARVHLKAMAKNPERCLIVVDPRRTETADLADLHLQIRPGGDAFLLAAMLATLFEEDLLADDWIAEHSTGVEQLRTLFAPVSVSDYAEGAGVTEHELRAATRRIAAARSVSILEDLGLQMAPHSTLNSWLEKLVYLLTGNFAKQGGMNIHTRFGGLGGGGASKGRTSPVNGERIITGLIPANAVPDEILTDHPDRFRAAIVESANPLHSLADSPRMRDAFDALELVVVIDVAMTETAAHADYILPAASQYEKWEATFFTLEFPRNDFHLRAPILDPLPGTLPEPEIHRRLVRALGAYDDDDLVELRAAAEVGRAEFADAFFGVLGDRPHLNKVVALVLYETLGPTLGEGNEAAAAVWGLAQRCAATYPTAVRAAGFEGDGLALGDALFDAIYASRSGVVFSVDDYDASWERLATPDLRINLVVDELVPELEELGREPAPGSDADPEFPFVLAAGERRSFTANTILRDPAWRKKDADGSLRMSSADAAQLGLADGGQAKVTTRRGSVVASVEVTDTLRPGHVTLPNGLGLSYPGEDGHDVGAGIAPNELTSGADRDWLAGTPWHKHVRARVEAV